MVDKTIRKVKVVWSDGSSDIFIGTFSWHSNVLWIMDNGSSNPIYISACNTRYLQIVDSNVENKNILGGTKSV